MSTFFKQSTLRPNRSLLVVAVLPLIPVLGCGERLNAVSIRPIYGWVDGCNSVMLSGSGFGADVVAEIGGNRMADIATTTDSEDVGYEFTATAPSATEPGYANVTVYSGGKEDTITGSGAYYYVACPASPHVDGLGATTAAIGTTVTISGCGFDARRMRVQLESIDGATRSEILTPETRCGTASIDFVVPSVLMGSYSVVILDLDGNLLAGDQCAAGDSGDTANTPGCAETPEILLSVEA